MNVIVSRDRKLIVLDSNIVIEAVSLCVVVLPRVRVNDSCTASANDNSAVVFEAADMKSPDADIILQAHTQSINILTDLCVAISL